jgi:predicted nucleotidyltransferase
MEKLLNQLTGKLQAGFGERLVAVVLYGSAAAGDHQAGYSDLNILCVLDRVTSAELKAAEPVFRWWRGQGNPAPLLLGEREVSTSTDCFAIEFHDILERHRILHGRDVLAGLAVDDRNYRAQVEHELRAKLLRLRQKASGVLSDEDHLRRLLLDSLSTFCVLFRHALRLRGVDPGVKKRDILARAREVFAMDSSPFEQLLDVREGITKPRQFRPAPLMDTYLEGIGTVIEAVDTLPQ